MRKLPPAWSSIVLGDGCLPVEKVRPDERPDEEFTYVDISSVDRSSLRISDSQVLVGRKAPSRARQQVRTGDTLFSTVRPNLRTLALVPPDLDGQIASTGYCVLRPPSGLNPRFLFYAVLEEGFQQRVLAKARGVSYPAVRDPDILEEGIPLPPRAEQDRIVEAIESAMAAVDEAGRAMESVRGLLDAFREATLEAACLGSFTEAGVPLASGERSGLPRGWEWRSIKSLAADEARAITDGPFGSNLKSAHYTDQGPRVIRLQNIGSGEFLDARAHISQKHFEALRNHEARAGDVVVASLGEVLPRACVVPSDLGSAIVKADCPRIRVGPDIRPAFLCAAMNSRPVRSQAARLIAGVGRPRLNLAKLKDLMVPTPPLSDQDAALEFLEATASARSETLRDLSTAGDRAASLRRSILHRAFTGRLVPQDPNEEPASELLERVKLEKAEREAEFKEAKKQARAAKKAAKTSDRASSNSSPADDGEPASAKASS